MPHLLDRLTDRGEVGEHTTRPTLCDVGHPYALSELSYRILSLTLGANEEDLLARAGHILDNLSTLIDLSYSLVQIDNVDTVALHKDVGSHSGVPLTWHVTKVCASL